MKMPSSRTIRLALTTVAFGGLIVALNAVSATATPGSGFVGTPLGRGTDQSNGTIPITHGLDIVVTENNVVINGRSGWHSHPGGAIVVIQVGEITTYRPVGNHCEITKYLAGQAFLERPGQPLNAVNTGSIPTKIYATFPNVPVGGSTRIEESDPGICPIPPLG